MSSPSRASLAATLSTSWNAYANKMARGRRRRVEKTDASLVRRHECAQHLAFKLLDMALQEAAVADSTANEARAQLRASIDAEYTRLRVAAAARRAVIDERQKQAARRLSSTLVVATVVAALTAPVAGILFAAAGVASALAVVAAVSTSAVASIGVASLKTAAEELLINPRPDSPS